jgi:hypothetical protein
MAMFGEWSAAVGGILPLISCVLISLFATEILRSPLKILGSPLNGRIADVILGVLGGYFFRQFSYPFVVNNVGNLKYCRSENVTPCLQAADLEQGLVYSIVTVIGALLFLFVVRQVNKGWGSNGVIIVSIVTAVLLFVLWGQIVRFNPYA